MRLLINILFLLTLLILLSADNCSGPGENYKEENREKQISETYQRIENEFIKDELSVEDLNAFEKRAIQKIQDIYDYINICADTALSLEFRKQANQIIQDNFIEKKDVKSFYNNFEIVEDTLNATLYFSKKRQTFTIEINSIEITNRLIKKSGSNYTGEIQFTQNMQAMNPDGSVDIITFRGGLKIMAVKAKKNFGNDVQEVWEVFLSESKAVSQI